MYEQNYDGGQSTSTADPDPAPNRTTEGWLWRRAKVTYDKGWYRLEDGEFICLGSDPSAQKKGEALGKVSGAVTTSEDRLEFTLCAPLATLEAARLALPRPMPTLASHLHAARQTRTTRRAPSAFAPRARRSSTAGWPRACSRRTSYRGLCVAGGCAGGYHARLGFWLWVSLQSRLIKRGFFTLKNQKVKRCR